MKPLSWVALLLTLALLMATCGSDGSSITIKTDGMRFVTHEVRPPA